MAFLAGGFWAGGFLADFWADGFLADFWADFWADGFLADFLADFWADFWADGFLPRYNNVSHSAFWKKHVLILVVLSQTWKKNHTTFTHTRPSHQICKRPSKKKMLVPTPVLCPVRFPSVHSTPAHRALAAPEPPSKGPWRRLNGAARRRGVVLAVILLSLVPYMLPEERQPALYKDGMTKDQRADRDQARRVRRALYP